jgi:hypothetical protein
MANNITTYLKNKILDHILGRTTYTAPATIYAALFSVRPAVDGTGGTELAGDGYARVAVTNNATSFPAASGGSKENGVAVTFDPATADWNTVVCVVFMDASSSGNMLLISDVISVIVTEATVFYYDPGDLIFTIN